MEENVKVVKTDLLIVGAGPAGASLACFLAAHGRTGIMISAAPGTAETPRAHITNPAALACLRDIGLEDECLALASPGNTMQHNRWCYSMAGEEYARVCSWGNEPSRKGDYDAASPCRHIDLPQTDLEPILTRRAVHSGWQLRFNTTFLRIVSRHADGSLTSEIHDAVLNETLRVHSRFLFGCDGARSQVIRELGIPLIKKAGQGLALNVLVEADMSHLVRDTRVGNLHWVFQSDKEHPLWGWAAVVRMVRPWTRWMFIFLPPPYAEASLEDMNPGEEETMARVRQFIGDDTVEAKLINSSCWTINETVAEKYSDGNAFLLGDAVHRHPPFNGLGSNTCVQDAFNLAWKISYVMSGKASPDLLSTYSAERQPVGVDVVTRANQGLRDHSGWMEVLGVLNTDVEKRKAAMAEFDDKGEAGRLKRRQFQEAIETTKSEFQGLGIEMNQTYNSHAVYLADETQPLQPLSDPVRHHLITTYPGRRLPHAWLNTRIPSKQISTLDLAGKNRFCLLAGASGAQAWKAAAKQVTSTVGVEVMCYSIGWKQDFEDVYFDWARRKEVEEDGCVLVRPDLFVAWRSMGMIGNPERKLEEVMRSVLCIK